jgi:hypothetical protein
MAPFFTGITRAIGGAGFGKRAGVSFSPFSATGGTITTPGNGYIYHTFTSPGTFTVSGASGIVEILVVGGGGGTGDGYAAGGGGGGVSIHRAYSIGSGLYSASVGAQSGTGRVVGNPSSFSNITSLGGGFGAGPAGGGPGGSGGGGQESTYPAGSGLQPSQNAPLTPNPNFSQYGNPGGNGQTTGFYAAGGGGGAGGAGGISPGPGPGGIGGPGIAVPGFEYNLVGISPVIPIANSPTNNHYGAGGGGWGYSSQPYPTGGGGIGGYTSPTPSQFGVNYLGGGSGNAYSSPAPTKTGGSGIVIIRYLT